MGELRATRELRCHERSLQPQLTQRRRCPRHHSRPSRRGRISRRRRADAAGGALTRRRLRDRRGRAARPRAALLALRIVDAVDRGVAASDLLAGRSQARAELRADEVAATLAATQQQLRHAEARAPAEAQLRQLRSMAAAAASASVRGAAQPAVPCRRLKLRRPAPARRAGRGRACKAPSDARRVDPQRAAAAGERERRGALAPRPRAAGGLRGTLYVGSGEAALAELIQNADDCTFNRLAVPSTMATLTQTADALDRSSSEHRGRLHGSDNVRALCDVGRFDEARQRGDRGAKASASRRPSP